ncbi:hypothetical protein [Cytobacillus kochii]|uniref:hypothetical protein n=1 Tax=Cytobacillus kochii TaxID=859143 RepID=UPI00203F6E62|nr:hypothetical protein [Cytobacillus kochii]MCM3321958.1 hypothetical protein [Cytobacillus kochii]MCM3343210.1 hypothetical protein [Cytobacillus kochii]
MTRQERNRKQHFNLDKILILLITLMITAITSLYFYSRSIIVIEAPKTDYGEKIVVQLPSGQKVFTYEKLVVKKDGKLIYQGEHQTIALTGGKIKYEDWD